MNKFNLIFSTSEDNTQNLCEGYWLANENSEFQFKTSYLAQTFNLPVNKITKIVKENCSAESTEIVCQNCDDFYVYISRSDFQEKQRQLNFYLNNWLCKKCIDEEKEKERQEREEKLEQYKNTIKQQYPSQRIILDLNNISLEDAVYLLSFIRFSANEELTSAYPLDTTHFEDRLSPQSDFDYEIVVQLFQHNIIRVDPNSHIESFTGENAKSFYPSKVFWLLPISANSNDTKGLILEIEEIFRVGFFPNDWREERLYLWKKIALQECLDFLAVSLNEHNLTLTPGEKTVAVINGLLENFSVGQICTLIWRAAKDAAAFLVRTGTYKKHAANTVVGSVQRYGERAIAEKWELMTFKRSYKCPQSIINHWC